MCGCYFLFASCGQLCAQGGRSGGPEKECEKNLNVSTYIGKILLYYKMFIDYNIMCVNN